MAEIPAFVIEYFLLGKTRRDAIERYTQDGGVVSDVWVAFAKDRSKPQRVLLAPSKGASAVVLGYSVHMAITSYRRSLPTARPRGRPAADRLPPTAAERDRPSVSPLENFVAVTLYFDELLRVILPLTSWWHQKHLGALRRNAVRSGPTLDAMLERAILNKLGRDGEVEWRKDLSASPEPLVDRRVVEAAPVAALIGVFRIADKNPPALGPLSRLNPRLPGFEEGFVGWINEHAEAIARASREELSRQVDPVAVEVPTHQLPPVSPQRGTEEGELPELIQRVFLDRTASLADVDANCTVKADAANRVFQLSCRNITWAIIDSGIATTHPAFLDHDARDRRGKPIVPTPTRIRATLDFTRIDRIRNFDLITSPEDSAGRREAIEEVIRDLEALPGRRPDPAFRPMATENLKAIAQQLEKRIPPDWSLIEPLIRLGDQDDGAALLSDHGTHVAGILGADWRRAGRDGGEERVLVGICPDIVMYDLRVIHPAHRRSTEFAILAALEYVQFTNARAGTNGPIIHGVNISMSIPHDVRNYGCGATPVCVACDRLASSGVVVVAAAGNRGWNEMELGFGNFVFSSITDPGNAREVITVGSTHRIQPHTYGVSYFSSRGPTGDGRIKPDLVAPGERIRGPIRGDADEELDGTSMAAPFVSGAAAMLIARNRELIGNPSRVKEILCKSATDLGREKYFQGHGLVDVLRALQSL